MRAKATGSWQDVGLWYDTLETPRRVATPQIKQKVAQLTSGLTDPLAKMRVLADYMQRNIRYMAVEVGIGGWQPHAADEVFSRQYGDCKDKATLLVTMLHEAGVDAYIVSVDHRRRLIRPDFPSVFMDHSIVAIRLPDNVSDAGLYAVVKDPQLGRLLFFDPTNEYVPLGYLPWYLQQTYALVITPGGES